MIPDEAGDSRHRKALDALLLRVVTSRKIAA
jgi:hypothetical protein